MEAISNPKNDKTRKLALLAILTAIVIIFQFIGMIPQISATKMSFVLIPISIGAMALGCTSGMWLGFIFGAVVLLGGILGADAFTHTLFEINPFLTILVCLGKGTIAGLCSGAVFKALRRINFNLAVIVASIVTPVVNTGLFCACMFLFFRSYLIDALQMNANASFFVGFGFVFVLILSNFLVELVINVILTPAVAYGIKKTRKIPYFK